MNLYSNPLEQFWIKSSRKRPAFFSFPNCKRGYVASWEIMNRQLFLNDIDGRVFKRTIFLRKKQVRYTMKSLFTRSAGKLVKALWFSGKLRIPIGKMTLYEHKDYDSRFEKEMIVTVAQGDVVKIVTLDYVSGALTVETQTFA